MATEKLKFKLELYATMWDKPPHAEILINDKSYFKDDITATEDKPQVIEFEHEVEEGVDYELIIKRSGKVNNQTVVNDKGDLLKDQLLNIKSIEIDEIDIGALVYEGIYTPEYPEPWATQQREAGTELKESFKNVTQIGHNGTWRFKFSSPFYMWLLENLY
jgi:chaperonin GroEL (HSP60 family)|tara:strand:- start:346 stop:828 length:483 start_codon:yes stop_codon:yes gene_type:complete